MRHMTLWTVTKTAAVLTIAALSCLGRGLCGPRRRAAAAQGDPGRQRRRSDGGVGAERAAGRLQRSPGPHGARRHDASRIRPTATGSTSGITTASATTSRCSTRSPGRWSSTARRSSTSPTRPSRSSSGTFPTRRTGIRAASSVVYDYKFDGSGRDYLIRNSEALTAGRDRHGPEVPDLRHHVAGHRPVEDRAGVGDHRHAAELVRARAAAASSSCARTKAGGRRTPATSTRRRASPASATSSSRSSI